MSTNTTNYNLQKDAQTDFYDVWVVNANLDKIDTNLKNIEDKVDEKLSLSGGTMTGDVQFGENQAIFEKKQYDSGYEQDMRKSRIGIKSDIIKAYPNEISLANVATVEGFKSISADSFIENGTKLSEKYAGKGHIHNYGDLENKPSALPANGGNSDTVDNLHASDLQNYNNLTNKPTSLKNPYALSLSLNSTSQGTYDGSSAKNINITAASVGAATTSHPHTVSQITDFADNVPITSVGTGLTLSNKTVKHSNSITAGTTKDGSGNLTNGGSFTVPKITYDAQGHITATSTNQYKLPTSVGSSYGTNGGEVFNDYINNVASGNNTHAEGYSTKATGAEAHAEGNNNTAEGSSSHAEGGNNKVVGTAAHVEGYANNVDGNQTHAEGYSNSAIGARLHVEGGCNTVTGDFSHVEGYHNTSDGYRTHAEGQDNMIDGWYGSVGGRSNIAHEGQHVIGHYNAENMSTSSSGTVGTAFIVGNGTSATKSNAFRVQYDGAVYAQKAYNATGADFAEYKEWLDGNTENEDRRGLFVTLDGRKIRKATSNDDFILGIVSSNPSVIGNAYEENWYQIYETDVFGQIIFEDVLISAEYDENNTLIKAEQTVKVPKLNQSYDNTETYIPRSQRQEWGIVGMLGEIITVDDGTCVVNGYCLPNSDGQATYDTTKKGYRVMDRIDKNHVLVWVDGSLKL